MDTPDYHSSGPGTNRNVTGPPSCQLNHVHKFPGSMLPGWAGDLPGPMPAIAGYFVSPEVLPGPLSRPATRIQAGAFLMHVNCMVRVLRRTLA